MCTFITGVLPKATTRQLLEPALKEFGFEFAPLNNSSVTAQLPKDMEYHLATGAYCDCDTELGSSNRQNARDKANPHAFVSKLKKKGWSESKIERWLQDKQASARKQQGSGDAKKWLLFLRKALSQNEPGYIGIMFHFYSGDVTTEAIMLKGMQRHAVDTIDESLLRGMNEDTLYLFARPRRKD